MKSECRLRLGLCKEKETARMSCLLEAVAMWFQQVLQTQAILAYLTYQRKRRMISKLAKDGK